MGKNDPLRQVGTRNVSTPQTEKIPGSKQKKNSAGGYSFKVDEWQQALRFLVLGTTGGSYYASEKKLTKDAAKLIQKLAEKNGPKLVELLLDVSLNGRAPRQQPTLLALAICAAAEDVTTRRLALAALPKIARTGTMLFEFAGYVEQFRGWGRSLRNAVGAWYLDKPVSDLAYQAVKYRQREGWSHRDLLRLAHPQASHYDTERTALFDWIVKGDASEATDLPAIVRGFDLATGAPRSASEYANLVTTFNLPWEALPDVAMNEPEVWDALLPNIGITALVRQLGRLSKIGVTKPMSKSTNLVVAKLSDVEAIQKSRIHPLNVLSALVTYMSGHGYRGTGSWNQVQAISDALEAMFYTSFGNVEPANKRTYLGLDVSGSMGCHNLANSPLSPRVASTAMALVTARTEPQNHIAAFSHTMADVDFGSKSLLEDALRKTDRIPFGRTDCALPMKVALSRGIDVDTFVIYTDSETYAGSPHPVQALKQYREKTGIPAKLVVVGMVSNGFTIADPTDSGMLDVVGFDTATPNLISGFSRGDF